MKERVHIADYNRLWAEALAFEDGSYSPRMVDDQVERDFWKRFMARKMGYAPDASSRLVLNKLLPLLQEYHVGSALELGPGWGNYTLDIAKTCNELTCVDISPDVLVFISRIASEQGITNIQTVASKWEDFESEHRYDLVFGYNCFYRLLDLASALRKMNDLSVRLCVMGMNMGLAPAWFHAMEDELGLPINWQRKDYIYFINILYEMGIDPNVSIIPFSKELVYPDIQALLKGETSRIAADTYDQNAVLSILLRYFDEHEDGSFHVVTKFRGALVYWEPVEL